MQHDPASAGSGTATATQVTPEQRATARRAVVASSIGNALEWFDIIVYASLAVVISALFFPSAGEQGAVLGLLLTFGTFAVSYLIRPVGAMVLGSYADRHGRKKALTLTIGLMMLGTALMAFAPTAQLVGPAAAVVILLSRLLQGFSAGGEFGTATAFLIENAPTRKAFYGSWQVATQGAAMLLASLFGLGLNTLISHDALYSWGWRVPFLVGLLIGPVGLYIRLRMDETPEFVAVAADKVESSPLAQTLVHHAPRWLAATATVGLASISVYLILFMPTFAVSNLHLPSWAGYLGGIISGIVSLVGCPLVGNLADRVGPARVMTVAAVAAVVLAIPLFALIVAVPTVAILTLVQVVLGLLMAFYFGPLPALLAAMFPTRIRTTGMSIAYNLGVTLFGGLAPLILTALIAGLGTLMAPGYYYAVVAVISLAGIIVCRRVFGQR
ncbi:MFS transporter [Tersicoccus sp. Bi-70]|uniref:MFS transporter n=1 Tax=Tersicoccus sp. Bi-70 TaxID=1897634 RepID=UPI000977720D|nr:MFS transporter [Tersicoccus sp. Bi-70]OMH34164.1 hypothetical protein BGP79_03155 [Tersicoccus sp. Bi-70]